jgi:CBS domain-containing protein
MDAGVPRCRLGDEAGPAVSGAAGAGWPLCVVVNEDGVVAGRLLADKVAPDDRRPAEDAMQPGPATIRPHEELASTLARMADHHVAVLLVTTPEGVLLGALRSQ